MHKRKWISASETLFILLLLAIVVNPELRAFLLIADAIGIELVLLMFAAQMQNCWPVIQPAVHRARGLGTRMLRRAHATSAQAARCLIPNEGPWLAANAALILASSFVYALMSTRVIRYGV